MCSYSFYGHTNLVDLTAVEECVVIGRKKEMALHIFNKTDRKSVV